MEEWPGLSLFGSSLLLSVYLLNSHRHFSYVLLMTPFQNNRDLWGDSAKMPHALAFFSLLVLNLSLGFLSFPSPPPLCLFFSLSVSLSATSERVPHSHTLNAVSHTYPVTPPGHCAIKSQSVFIQTHGNQ